MRTDISGGHVQEGECAAADANSSVWCCFEIPTVLLQPFYISCTDYACAYYYAYCTLYRLYLELYLLYSM